MPSHDPATIPWRSSGFSACHDGITSFPVALKLRSGEIVHLSYGEARQLATDLGEAANWEGNEDAPIGTVEGPDGERVPIHPTASTSELADEQLEKARRRDALHRRGT